MNREEFFESVQFEVSACNSHHGTHRVIATDVNGVIRGCECAEHRIEAVKSILMVTLYELNIGDGTIRHQSKYRKQQ